MGDFKQKDLDSLSDEELKAESELVKSQLSQMRELLGIDPPDMSVPPKGQPQSVHDFYKSLKEYAERIQKKRLKKT